MARVVLVNMSLVRVPAIGPYAIDILGSALEERGHQVDVLDLTRSDDGIDAIPAYFSSAAPDLVGLTMRNRFDLYFPSLGKHEDDGSFLASHLRVIQRIKELVPPERIVIGGVGFSTAPFRLLRRFALPVGVRGPGEEILPLLAEAAGRGAPLAGIEYPKEEQDGLCVFDGRRARPQQRVQRKFFDNLWYYEYGGLGNLRSSNGCGMRCGYCAEPYAKGSTFKRAAVEDVLEELDQLVEMGIYDVLTADSEFNMPFAHSKAVLKGIIERRYPKEFRLWAYMQPVPFDAEYAELLARAGVPGVNLGTDHTDPEMLKRMNKWFSLAEVTATTELCQRNGIAVMHELLFGYPGDTPEKMFRAIDDLRAQDPTVIGVTVGLGVLDGTPLGELMQRKLQAGEPLDGFYFRGEPFIDPVFYVDPSIPIPEIYGRLEAFVGADIDRIMIPRTSQGGVDTDNQLVGSKRIETQLHKEKKKGAYWYHYRPVVPAG